MRQDPDACHSHLAAAGWSPPYYEIGSRIPAARWDDLQIGVDCIARWERVAVVTDIGWIRQTVKALRFLIGGDIRVFTTSEAGDGLAWIRSP